MVAAGAAELVQTTPLTPPEARACSQRLVLTMAVTHFIEVVRATRPEDLKGFLEHGPTPAGEGVRAH